MLTAEPDAVVASPSDKVQPAKSPHVYATLCRFSPPPVMGGRPKRWTFAVPDLAALLGMSERSVLAALKAGKLDPTNLESLCFAWAKRQGWAKP